MFAHKNKNIFVYDEAPKKHGKASETYIHVKFTYPNPHRELDLCAPIEYRPSGIFASPEADAARQN